MVHVKWSLLQASQKHTCLENVPEFKQPILFVYNFGLFKRLIHNKYYPVSLAQSLCRGYIVNNPYCFSSLSGHIYSWGQKISWCEPNVSMDVWYRIKYQGSFGRDQMFLWILWMEPNVLLGYGSEFKTNPKDLRKSKFPGMIPESKCTQVTKVCQVIFLQDRTIFL